MSPGVHDDVSTGHFSSQVLEAASSVPQADTIHLTQHPSLSFPLLAQRKKKHTVHTIHNPEAVFFWVLGCSDLS